MGKTFGHIEQSCFLKENFSITDGSPPETNLANEKNNGEAVLNLINRDLVLTAHDVSSGGLIIGLCEMSINSGVGIKINKPKILSNLIEYFFGEDQGRYILEVNTENINKVEKILKSNNIYYENIGKTQSKYFEIEGEMKSDINELYKINNQWYNDFNAVTNK